jgi:hypothetical protein
MGDRGAVVGGGVVIVRSMEVVVSLRRNSMQSLRRSGGLRKECHDEKASQMYAAHKKRWRILIALMSLALKEIEGEERTLT